jgi:peroxin-2
MGSRPGPEDATTSRLARHPRSPAAPRVSQVDAEELDEGLVGMLAEKVERSLGLLRVSLKCVEIQLPC